MKKYFPYIIGGGVLLLLIVMLSSTASRQPRKMDERITLRQSDKIPYGTRVARELLSSLYPEASVPVDRKYPGGWDSIDLSDDHQAVVLVADYMDAEQNELEELADFVERGNYVFIISRAASDGVSSFFGFSYRDDYFNSYSTGDSLRLKLESPMFSNTTMFVYPGLKYAASFSTINERQTTVLGRNSRGDANFIQINKGRGSFFIHTAPLAFSNYFILHKKNAAYYEQAFSVFPKNIKTILWNEYFLQKPHNPDDQKDPNWLSALFSYPAFKWGLLIGAFTLLLYVLLGMRRRQRMIPPFEKPKNDSLDFVKTLGRLYYDRRDHKNLALKMAAYFLEHVRSKYKLPTHTLDEAFVRALHFKTGYPEPETKNIVDTIHTIQLAYSITDQELAHFYKQLELFYQNT